MFKIGISAPWQLIARRVEIPFLFYECAPSPQGTVVSDDNFFAR